MQNKADLELCKKFAELEGYWAVTDRDGIVYIMKEYMEAPEHPLPTRYNPITDLALNCAARDKYEVEICYRYKEALIWIESTWIKASFKECGISRAVIVAILKSQSSKEG
jgi:hypothetical protein